MVEKASKGRSKRTVPLGSVAVTVLRGHRERQDSERVAAADIYQDGGCAVLPAVFDSGVGAALPVISLHDGRHTAATTGADAGVPQHVMKDLLGHADARTTDEWYTHVLDPSRRKAADLMEAAVFGATQPATRMRRAVSANPTRRLAAVSGRHRVPLSHV